MLIRSRSLFDRVRLTTSAILALTLAAGCASGAVRLYEGPKQPDEAVAVLAWSGLTSVVQINDKPVESGTRRAELLPGQYKVVYWGEFWGSVMLGPPIRRVGPLTAVLSLQAGRTYVVNAEQRGPRDRPYLYLWIEDSASGEVLHGERPPR